MVNLGGHSFLKGIGKLFERQLFLLLKVKSSEESLSEVGWETETVNLQELVKARFIDCVTRASIVAQLFENLPNL
jgi:hypothetical protein